MVSPTNLITEAHGWTDEVRQAVTALEDKYGIELISGPHHAKWVDVACYEIGGGAIRMYKDDVETQAAEIERLKAQVVGMRDDAQLAANSETQAYYKVASQQAEIDRLKAKLAKAEEVITAMEKQALAELNAEANRLGLE